MNHDMTYDNIACILNVQESYTNYSQLLGDCNGIATEGFSIKGIWNAIKMIIKKLIDKIKEIVGNKIAAHRKKKAANMLKEIEELKREIADMKTNNKRAREHTDADFDIIRDNMNYMRERDASFRKRVHDSQKKQEDRIDSLASAERSLKFSASADKITSDSKFELLQAQTDSIYNSTKDYPETIEALQDRLRRAESEVSWLNKRQNVMFVSKDLAEKVLALHKGVGKNTSAVAGEDENGLPNLIHTDYPPQFEAMRDMDSLQVNEDADQSAQRSGDVPSSVVSEQMIETILCGARKDLARTDTAICTIENAERAGKEVPAYAESNLRAQVAKLNKIICAMSSIKRVNRDYRFAGAN